MADGHTHSFGRVAKCRPLNLLSFVARSPNFSVADLFRADINASMELLDVEFPATFEAYDDESAAHFLDRLRFPPRVRHLALEVFTRSFFDEPRFFSAGELLTMFHLYFLGSAEGLLFDSATDDFDTSLWAPARSNLERLGVQVLAPAAAIVHRRLGPGPPGVEVGYGSGGRVLPADAVVLATNLGTTRRLIAAAPDLGTSTWRDQVAAAGNAPPFAVWRVWLDRPVRPDRPAFLGTTGFGLMDNVSVLERFEAGAAEWSRRHGGSVVELHAYALAGRRSPTTSAGRCNAGCGPSSAGCSRRRSTPTCSGRSGWWSRTARPSHQEHGRGGPPCRPRTTGWSWPATGSGATSRWR